MYIYVLVDPRDHEIRYVGKTKISDLTVKRDDHVYKALWDVQKNTPRYAWIRKLRQLSLLPSIDLVQEVNDEFIDGAERYWISYFRSIGCRLTNATPGGDGFVGAQHTEETKAKIRASVTGKFWTLNVSDDARARHREGARRGGRVGGKIGGRLSAGRVMSDDVRRRISDSVRSLPRTPCSSCGRLLYPSGHGRHTCKPS